MVKAFPPGLLFDLRTLVVQRREGGEFGWLIDACNELALEHRKFKDWIRRGKRSKKSRKRMGVIGKGLS